MSALERRSGGSCCRCSIASWSGTAVVRIARALDPDGFYTRTLHLIRVPTAERLRFRPRAGRMAAAVAVAS